jgi:hypothetical protein
LRSAGNDSAVTAVATHRSSHTEAQHKAWLGRQIARAEKALQEAAPEAEAAPVAAEGAPSGADTSLIEEQGGAFSLTMPAEVRKRMEAGS